MKDKLKRLLGKSELLKGFSVLMVGTLISQSLPLLISPLLSRVYSPDEFGQFSIFTTIVGLLSVIFTLKYEMAIQLADSSQEAIKILGLCVFIILIGFVSSELVSIVAFHFLNFSKIYLYIPVCTFFFSLLVAIERYYNYRKQYREISTLKLARTGFEALFNLTRCFNLLWTLNLVLSFLIAQVFSLCYAIYNFKELFNHSNVTIFSREAMKSIAIKYLNFPKYTLPHTLLNTFSSNIPIFLIPLAFTQKELGLYVFGTRIVQAPLAVISSSLFNVLSQYYIEKNTNYDHVIPKFTPVLRCILFGSLIALPLLFFLPDIFSFAFGRTWHEAGKLIIILYPTIILNFIVASFSFIPVAKYQQRQALQMELIFTSLKILPFGLCLFRYFDFNDIMIIYSILTSVYLLFALFWLKKVMKSVKIVNE